MNVVAFRPSFSVDPPPNASLAHCYALGDEATREWIRIHLLPGASQQEFESWVVLSSPWRFFARVDQLPPPGDDWQIWLMQSGRGAGKTRGGAEWAFEQAASNPGWLVGVMSPTFDDLNRVTFDGPSGLLRIVERHRNLIKGKPIRKPWQINFRNGSRISGYAGEAYERLRGPQHHAFWADEVAGMARLADLAYEQIMFGLRLGATPRLLITSTPKVIALFKRLNEREAQRDPAVRITRATTMDNSANLSAMAIEELRRSYAGTRLGDQELMGALLSDVPGSLWPPSSIRPASVPTRLDRVVVGVDPSGAANAKSKSDEIGIVVAGVCYGMTKAENRYFVLADYTLIASPLEWARKVIEAYDTWGCDRVVAEANFGGALVQSNIEQADTAKDGESASSRVPVATTMVNASRGKVVRAEPIAGLYEQERVWHCSRLTKLEDQMHHMTTTGYVGDGSPDRVDALVWALTELSGGGNVPIVAPVSVKRVSYWRP